MIKRQKNFRSIPVMLCLAAVLTFMIVPPASSMQSPAPGSTLNSSSVAFTWNRPAGADDFDLIIGTTGAGSSDIRSSSVFNDTSMTVNGLPTDGRTVYVRLWTWIGDWQYQDYTYQAVDISGEGGNGDAAITETTITSPSGNSVFQIGETIHVAVDAKDPDGVAAVSLMVDGVIYDINNTSPFNFSLIGLTLGTYTLVARAEDMNGAATDSEVITLIVEEVIDQNPNDQMQSPIPGSILDSSTVAFTWNRPAGADDFDLIIGTTGAGSSDIRSSSVFNDTSMTVSGLPADGRTVYVRLWTWIDDWQYQDYTYQAVNRTAETPNEDNPPEEPDDSGNPPTSDPQGINYNFYFGHLHEHTQFSDGDGTPEDMFMAGISRGLDFMAASDHGYSISSSEAYETASVSDEFYNPGTFTTFASVEVSDGDHIGVHDQDHSVFWIDDNYGHNYADIYEDMAAYGAVGVFHHPDRYGSDAFGGMSYNATGDQVMTMMEIANKGDIEDSHYDLWIDALDKGWHIAPAAGDDNHSEDWGRDDIRTVVLAERNNRESLIAAMAERRVYATDDSNLEIDFRINGNVMGSIVDNSAPATMTVLTRDGNGENIALMELITSGGWLVATHTGSEDWTMELDPGNPYYFIRITQDDGDRAVTAPIWLEHGGAPDNSNADPVSPTSLAGTYHTNGGVNTTGYNITAYTPANNGDYEIVSLGSSSCGGGTDAPIDRLLMEDQGFRLVGVEGEFDRKVEVWIRQNTGQDSVTLTGDGYDVAWNILTLNNEDYSFDINSLEVEVSDTYFSGRDHTTAPLNAPGGNYFNLVV